MGKNESLELLKAASRSSNRQIPLLSIYCRLNAHCMIWALHFYQEKSLPFWWGELSGTPHSGNNDDDNDDDNVRYHWLQLNNGSDTELNHFMWILSLKSHNKMNLEVSHPHSTDEKTRVGRKESKSFAEAHTASHTKKLKFKFRSLWFWFRSSSLWLTPV